jgi:hypothetical protein
MRSWRLPVIVIALLVVALVAIGVLAVDLASDRRWLDLALLALAIVLPLCGYGLQAHARKELFYRRFRKRSSP